MDASVGVMSQNRQVAKARLDRRIKACRKCTSPDRLNVPGETASAPGYGSIDSPVAIVGEALCRRCMAKQEPFYGGSGRGLDRCFERAGHAKTELFITNSIHCHPPNDRDPLVHETENCAGFLREELRDIVQPRLVIAVGKFAKSAVLRLYPEPDGREISWPFRVPRSKQSDLSGLTHLLFPPHPYYIMTRATHIRDEYERRVARAIQWAFDVEGVR